MAGSAVWLGLAQTQGFRDSYWICPTVSSQIWACEILLKWNVLDIKILLTSLAFLPCITHWVKENDFCAQEIFPYYWYFNCYFSSKLFIYSNVLYIVRKLMMCWLILCLEHSILIISNMLRFARTRWDNFDSFTWTLVLRQAQALSQGRDWILKLIGRLPLYWHHHIEVIKMGGIDRKKEKDNGKII